MPVREFARAKVNLTLEVLGKRPDGYHELQSLVTFAGLHDVVTLEPGTAVNVAVTGPFAREIEGENLLVRVLSVLRDVEPALMLGAVCLEKNLPVAAGLGGGSADAAALLRAVRRANPKRAAATDWRGIAQALGADVPVCFADAPAVMGGKGERLAPLTRLPEVRAVLVNPRRPLGTAQVFAALAAGPVTAGQAALEPPAIADLAGLCTYVRARGNGLEGPAIGQMSAIGDMKAALERQPGCRLAAMSGSGPTCFGLFADEEGARRAAARIASDSPGWWVAHTSLAGAGG
jgi:4-diphosphocytidyl-2-C-methyl-D-erythritol kinase